MRKISNFPLARIFAVFAFLSFLLRIIFLVWEKDSIDFSFLTLVETFSFGLLFDLVTFGYLLTIPTLYFCLIPNKIFNSKTHQKANQILYFLFLFIIVFSCFSEVVFWEEFQTRFNFIAVDYLIYTTEVIGNIVESYPISLLVSAVSAIAAVIFIFTRKKILVEKTGSYFENSKKSLAVILLVVVSFFTVDSSRLSEISSNNYVNEITKNGIYELFSAYRNNEIDYESFYATLGKDKLFTNLRHNISKQEPKSKFLNDKDISRLIAKPEAGAEKRYNVIFVSIESMSADFMKAFGNSENITPNLDFFATQGLFFTNMKATGTRTVRGLEALSLSIPPTPGNSIVRRPNNENLFNISSPLIARGYEAKFIYGGDGYFDNMNYFFGNNGFETVDRPKFSSDEITFSNAWGVADEDLFDKTIKEADKSYAKGKPFLNFVMTTSNHRPFTYPDGKIDIDSKTGRNGAVKYSDYAIGKLVEKAKNKEWFKNTIFVFVADHCAGSAGNTDVPLWRYQIPAIFYAPEIIKPRIFDKNISQIDIAPTLMGLLNLEYKSKFFGTDVLHNEKYLDQHAFVSTYSDIGYFKNEKLYLLKLKKEKKFFDVSLEHYGWQGSKETVTDEYNKDELDEAISYYQGASYLFKHEKLKNFDK
ncbi:MAG: LTA synthase family protein [Rickettsiales bacterium]|nr:LTA synthase family protein [Rickettsiales bacterium]